MLRFFVGFLIDHRFSRYGVTAKGGADAGNLAIARCRVSPTPSSQNDFAWLHAAAANGLSCHHLFDPPR